MGLDGRNLLLSKGTGVTSYGRTLAQILANNGYQAELLCDTPLAGAPAGRVAPGGNRALRSRLEMLLLGLRAFDRRDQAAELIGSDGASEKTSTDHGNFDRLRFASNVFLHAHIHFRIYGRPLGIGGAHPPDLMHWSFPLPMFFRGIPNVYTIHDLIPLTHPNLTRNPRRRFERRLAGIMAKAHHIVTVSETARRDIINLLGCAEDKVTNTSQAVFFPTEIIERAQSEIGDDLAKAVGLPVGGYFLCIGLIEPRKNIPRLIEAYLASGVRSPLVIAGPDGWKAAEALAKAAPHLVSPHAIRSGGGIATAPTPSIIPLGYLDRRVLISAIQGAKALLFPSLAEGFGLPIVEAMALGTPVMTSNLGATAEVAGDAALLVDPFDIGDIARGIRELDANAELRRDLIACGKIRSRAFSLDSYSARMDQLYVKVLRETKPIGTIPRTSNIRPLAAAYPLAAGEAPIN